MQLVFETKTARAVEAKALEGIDPNYGTPRKRRNLIRLAMRDGCKCRHCQTDVYFPWMVSKQYHRNNRARSATFDHIIPKSQGGTYHLSNGMIACKQCNNARGDMSVEQFQALIAAYGGSGQYKMLKKATRKQKRAERKAKRELKRRAVRVQFLWDLATLLYIINWNHRRFGGM